MSYIITQTQAAQYISDMLGVSNLKTVAKNIALGGTFLSPILPVASGNGLIFWMNAEGNGSSYDFFTAYQEYPDPRSKINNRLPVGNQQLYQPGETFVYTPTSTDIATVENFLSNQNTGVAPSSSTITQQKVKDNVREYVKVFPKDSEGYPYSDRAFAFFVAQDSVGDLHTLLSQPGATGLRYFIGFDQSADPEPINRLRIIFCAVDSTGSNILTGGPALFLQKGEPK